LNKTANPDPFGLAISDYYSGVHDKKIRIESDITETDYIPVRYYFRSEEEMPKLEQQALDLCKGTVLDVGAATGCHSVMLQERGLEVYPIDISSHAVEVMKNRNLDKARQADFFNLEQDQFDTILILMNGIGICGTLDRLNDFFEVVKRILKPGGQVLLDSSDIIYMFEGEDGSYQIDLNNEYYGEVTYEMEYDGIKSQPFKWLFVGFDLLSDFANRNGFKCELMVEGEHFDYLTRITF